MVIQNFPLKNLNTFRLEFQTRYYIKLLDPSDLLRVFSDEWTMQQPQLILGGGSNLLMTKNWEGLCLNVGFKGIEILEETKEHYYVKVAAGENWHNFVLWSINNNLNGIENLSLIPGKVGASPMQNIGAYGVEIKDTFHSLTAFDKHNLCFKEFSLAECKFGYRESVFKRELKDQYIITAVTFRLNKHLNPNTSYGAIETELNKNGIKHPTAKDISNAVIAIRTSKLPDPKIIGNAGSFFKNPLITKETLAKIQAKFPDVPNYATDTDMVKTAAGWLIEKAGWKGYREGDFGVHAKQALVLVNYGNATGKEIFNLSSNIIASIEDKFGITLEREVNII